MKAIAHLTITKGNIKGFVIFEEDLKKKTTKIRIKVSGLSPGKHGFHIHEFADFRNGCKSLGPHYNPHNKNHGGPDSKERHIGDLGNIVANSKGEVSKTMYNKTIKLRGKYSVVGRSVVIHEKEDDLGLGGNAESLRTGNSMNRIACGIIGFCK